MRTNRATALSPTGFYGWHVVAYSAIALAATGPGQTVGISLFIDPLIADLGLSRSAVSTAYLVGTLAAAVALPWIGRALDRFGVRRTMAVIGAAFGAVLIGASFITDALGLTVAFVGLRMAGQGALGLTATTAVAWWFTRRRGFAAGIVSAIGALGISSTPLVLEYTLLDLGWRTAWRVEGLVIWAVVLPIALLGMRDRPADLGQQPDGPVADSAARPAPVARGLTRAQTLRHPYFWLIASAVALTGLLTTAVAFHQISLLTARGLTQAQAAGNFVPQTAAGLVATLGAGVLIDRFAGRWMIVASMLTLSAALAWGAVVEPGLSAIAFGAMLGAAGSVIRAVEVASLPRAFGTLHIGSIRGLIASISVAGTACGPLLFAVVVDRAGSYTPALLVSAALPIGVAVWAVLVREPRSELIGTASVPSPRPAPEVAVLPAVVPAGTVRSLTGDSTATEGSRARGHSLTGEDAPRRRSRGDQLSSGVRYRCGRDARGNEGGKMPVTRTEIADVMGGALGRGPRSADEIVSFAVAAGARPEVIARLNGLPQRSYAHLRDLWPELADVPVEV